MIFTKPKWAGMFICMILTVSGCSTKAIKTENEELKQQIQQEEQVLQDYADKLESTQESSLKERTRHQAEMATMRRDLNKALEDNQAVVKKLENLTVIDIEHSILFKSGQSELSQEGKEIVKLIAATFNKHKNFHMRIEGHTDDLPISAKLKHRYYSNWELSAARAATVVRYMIFALDVPRTNLSIAGYADNRPVANNDTEEGRTQNRRIRAVIFRS